jgi:hypothetical protein
VPKGAGPDAKARRLPINSESSAESVLVSIPDLSRASREVRKLPVASKAALKADTIGTIFAFLFSPDVAALEIKWAKSYNSRSGIPNAMKAA